MRHRGHPYANVIVSFDPIFDQLLKEPLKVQLIGLYWECFKFFAWPQKPWEKSQLGTEIGILLKYKVLGRSNLLLSLICVVHQQVVTLPSTLQLLILSFFPCLFLCPLRVIWVQFFCSPLGKLVLSWRVLVFVEKIC